MKTATLIAAVLAVCLAATGCATPTIDRWADRAERGVLYAENTTRQFTGKLRVDLTAQRATGVALALDGLKAAHADERKDVDAVLAVMAGALAARTPAQIEAATARLKATRPPAEKLTAAVFAGYQTRLEGWLTECQGRRDRLDADETRALGNLQHVRLALDGIRKAAHSYGTEQDVNRRLDRIEDLVRAAIERPNK